MYEKVMFETLSGTFNAISRSNVYNVMLHVNAASLRGLTSFIFCLIHVVSESIVYKIPPGGRGSIASPRPIIYARTFSILFRMTCQMHLSVT